MNDIQISPSTPEGDPNKEDKTFVSTPLFPNAAFSTKNPLLQLSWDATSFSAFETCPRYYLYNIVFGYNLSPGDEISENPHFRFGIMLHSASELYDRHRASGADHEEALKSAFKYALEATWNSKLNRPWTTDEPTKTRQTLLRTIVWYLDNYKDENLRTHILADGRPAVELPFRFNINALSDEGKFVSPFGEEYRLCGYLDKVVSWNDELWIRDIKTTKYPLDESYFRQYTPNNQVSLYSIAGSVILHQTVDGMIIDGIQVLVEGSRFVRKQIGRSQNMLEEWLRDFWFRIREAEYYAKTQYYPMNKKSCGFGRNQCQFRPICSSEPEVRLELLETNYTKRIWNPLEPR